MPPRNIGSARAARGWGCSAGHGHEMVYLGIHAEYLPFGLSTRQHCNLRTSPSRPVAAAAALVACCRHLAAFSKAPLSIAPRLWCQLHRLL